MRAHSNSWAAFKDLRAISRRMFSVAFMITHQAPNANMTMTPTGGAIRSTGKPARRPATQTLARNGSGGPGVGIGG